MFSLPSQHAALPARRPPGRRIAMSLVLLCALALARAEDAPPVTTQPSEGGNLVVLEQITPTYVRAALEPLAFNWFSGVLADLPVGEPVTLGFIPADPDTTALSGDVSKWIGLVPLVSYSDQGRLDTYEWFVKDADGVWRSGAPWKIGAAREAGDGPLPQQTAVPVDLAPAFLAAAGRYWAPWQEVDQAAALPHVNIFRFTHTFARPTATVAMRVPYPPRYLQALLADLAQAAPPGVTVETLGATPQGRPVQLVRLTDPDDPTASTRTTLVLAREHGTEAASSWLAQALLRHLLAPEGAALRQGRTWLLIPLLDPDAAAAPAYEGLTDRFYKSNIPPTPPEVLAYTRYLTDYIADGGQIDLAVSLHNIEAAEGPHLFSPLGNTAAAAQSFAFTQAFFARAQQAGFDTADPAVHWYYGTFPLRLGGWCALRLGALDLVYEVNDRYPARRLRLDQLDALGGLLAAELVAWQRTEEGQDWHAQVAAHLADHRRARAAYWAAAEHAPAARTAHESITLGY